MHFTKRLSFTFDKINSNPHEHFKADSRISLSQKTGSEREAQPVDEIYAWDQSVVYFSFFDCVDNNCDQIATEVSCKL